MKKKFKWEKFEDPLFTFNNDDDDDEDDVTHQSFKALQTPFGILSITNHILASTKFDFWMLHTNFRITHQIAHIMKGVAGVESMNVMTRYRIRFGFPMSGLFDSNVVKDDIEKTVLDFFRSEQNEKLSSIFDDKTTGKIKEVRDYLDDHRDNWIMYVLPNGHMEVVTKDDNTCDVFTDKQELFNNLHKLIGGAILSSED